MNVLDANHRDAWTAVLNEVSEHDFYHTHAYHLYAQESGEGHAHLFVHREGIYTVALPLLLRPLKEAEGLESLEEAWWDATSVYGYSGPVASHRVIPEPVVANFRAALVESLRERRVIALFSRLHPLIPQDSLLAGLGEVSFVGKTISIDLASGPEAPIKQYRSDHLRGLKKLRGLGMLCIEDKPKERLGDFIEIYTATMRRVNANAYYFFDRGNLERLCEQLGSDARLFFVHSGNELACAALFVSCRGFVQYHLGGTREEYLRLSPMKLMVDEVRLWATRQESKALHLGGGVGGREDSLFWFKAGFSDRRNEFNVWRWVIDPGAYAAACSCKEKWNASNGLKGASEEFFPQYRSKAVCG